MVRANGAVSLRELARVVQTSEVTVRRDVRALEAEGLLDRGTAVRYCRAVSHASPASRRSRISPPPRRPPSPTSPRTSWRRARPSWSARAPPRRSWPAAGPGARADGRHQLPAGRPGARPRQPGRGRDDRRHAARLQLRPRRQRRRAVPAGAAGVAGVPLGQRPDGRAGAVHVQHAVGVRRPGAGAGRRRGGGPRRPHQARHGHHVPDGAHGPHHPPGHRRAARARRPCRDRAPGPRRPGRADRRRGDAGGNGSAAGDGPPSARQRRDVPLPGPRRQGPGLRTAVALGAASDQGQGAERAARVADMRRR